MNIELTPQVITMALFVLIGIGIIGKPLATIKNVLNGKTVSKEDLDEAMDSLEVAESDDEEASKVADFVYNILRNKR